MPRNTLNPFIAMATGALFIVTVLPINAFDDSLLLYLPFDENTGGIARDLTGKTGGGKIIGGTKIVQGKRGRALQLDGETGYVEIGLTPELIEAERDSFTAELWLMTTAKAPKVPEAVVSGFHGHLIFGGHGPDGHNNGHWSMFFFSDIGGDDKFRFAAVNVFVASGNGTPGVISEKPKLNDGEWHHIAGVRDEDAKELRSYIDGEFVGKAGDFSRALNSKPIQETARRELWLGIHAVGDGGNPGNGLFPARYDEVSFWNRAMSHDEIKGIMSLSVSPQEKLPLSWGGIKTRWVD
ncbi:MAG: LamG domain-containing protein [Candidatus Poribacteria bacterium]|nr:LamG domain-containing protein [Candidatus Poribacteria bacterium]